VSGSDILAIVYYIALVPVAVMAAATVAITALGLRSKPSGVAIPQTVDPGELPFVSVQIPVFNDPVAVRCVEACLSFVYPASRYEIMILDDSNDPETTRLLSNIAELNPGRVVLVRRTRRTGYKPGALVAAMPLTRGELIAIFDADFVPAPDLLGALVAPFSDRRVAIVQGRQGFLNAHQGIVARFASYLLAVQHHVIMPVAAQYNAVLFCGTAGVLRRLAIDDAGGWNTGSVTEDSDLSVRILARGWKSIYLPKETPSELPTTLPAFLKQQTRWCFGGLRVFIDHASLILVKPGLRVPQRAILTYFTLGNVAPVSAAAMTLAGLAAWIFVAWNIVSGAVPRGGIDGSLGLACTGGFLSVAGVALHRSRRLRELPWLMLSACSVALVLAFANAGAAVRALLLARRPLFEGTSWVCTPKIGNAAYANATPQNRREDVTMPSSNCCSIAMSATGTSTALRG